MSTFRQFAERVRWRWVLPLIMVVITASCIIIGTFERRSFPSRYGQRWQAPAHMIAMFLNGPILLVGNLPSVGFEVMGVECVGFERLPVVALFWWLVGWALDRKLSRELLLTNATARWLLFSFGFGWSLLLFVSDREYVLVWIVLTQWRDTIPIFSRFGLWTPGVVRLVWPIWEIIGIAYFGRKLWKMFRVKTKTEFALTA